MSMERTPLDAELEAELRDYYTRYYRDQLCIPSWQSYVEARLTESDEPKKRLETLERWFNRPLRAEDRVLVVGTGTGAELEAFIDIGCHVEGIEPDEQAVRIARKKCALRGVAPERVHQAVAEQLPFADDTFDVVSCFTVLEHVADVEKSLDEMIRVCKPGGHICIWTPDYRHFYEPHYKLLMPMFLPRPVVAGLLRLRGKSPDFLWSLQLVNARQLTNLLQDRAVIAFYVIFPWPSSWQARRSPLTVLSKVMARAFSIQRNQLWIVRKLDQPP
jgi:ubiquinone/menaquinone biosynthesis C-methylase UbiE